MDKFTIYKYGETRIQFNEIDTNEVKIVDFICEYLRDEVYQQLTVNNATE